jgi:hypothetical protein
MGQEEDEREEDEASCSGARCATCSRSSARARVPPARRNAGRGRNLHGPSAPRCCARAWAAAPICMTCSPGTSCCSAVPACRRPCCGGCAAVLSRRIRDRSARPDRRAGRAAARFLRAARARELRCVRVIHGKGLRSGTRGPVLKNTVNALLRRPIRCWPSPRRGRSPAAPARRWCCSPAPEGARCSAHGSALIDQDRRHCHQAFTAADETQVFGGRGLQVHARWRQPSRRATLRSNRLAPGPDLRRLGQQRQIHIHHALAAGARATPA